MSTDPIFIPLTTWNQKEPKVKISVIGAGSVGMAAAFSLLTRSIANVIALVDYDENKVKGEILDLQQCSQFTDTCNIIGGIDYSDTKNSEVVLITAGVRQIPDESRLNLVNRNVAVLKKIVPEVVKYSPNCIIVVVSNPVDILTYVTWKLSGFPRNRIIGSGTILDSARFRHILGKKLNLSADSIHGYIIGEHGDSSVPVWSKVSVGGENLCQVHPELCYENDSKNFSHVHKEVKNSAYEIIRLKGYTCWAIGLCCANLCSAIIRNKNVVLPLTTNIKGLYGLEFDVFLSMPCVVNACGVASVVNLSLNDKEVTQLKKSAENLNEIAKSIEW